MWRFKGTPHYLNEQAKRLGVSQVLADRARNNPEIYRCALLLAKLQDCFQRKPKGEKFCVTEAHYVEGVLEQCEQELQKLHMLAATADAMLAEAYRELDFVEPLRTFSVEVLPDREETSE
jgi:hypothetical protein